MNKNLFISILSHLFKISKWLLKKICYIFLTIIEVFLSVILFFISDKNANDAFIDDDAKYELHNNTTDGPHFYDKQVPTSQDMLDRDSQYR